MSIAARVAGWQRRTGGVFVAPSAVAGADDTSPKVEIFINEAWTDITPYVRYESKIKITRGRQNEGGSGLTPSTCAMTLGNPGGLFSPRQPTSPFYGQLGQNTPLRVSIVHNGIRLYRFYGEVSEWPPKSDISGDDVTVSITASGITRRLQQGNSPVASVLKQTLKDLSDVVAYWPLEDGEFSTSLGSGLAGGRAMTIKGTPRLASNDDFLASDSIPVMNTASFTGSVLPYTATGETTVRFLMSVPDSGMADGQRICVISTTGSARTWELFHSTLGALRLRARDSDGVELFVTGSISFAINGKQLRVSLTFTETGGDIDWIMQTLEPGGTTGGGGALEFSGTLASNTFGRVTRVTMAADRGMTDTAIGHVSVQSDVVSFFTLSSQLNAYNGENPTTRLLRLCEDNSISLTVVSHGLTGNLVTMGYQGIKTLVELINECEATDLGILFEPRDQIGLGYRSRLSLYNQDAAVTLSNAGHNLSEALTPVDDDQQTKNDITITRAQGSLLRLEQTEGAKSVLPPPLGVGRYDDAQSLSIETDSQLGDHAGWRLHLGTVDEARYPTLSLHLANPSVASDAALLTALLNLDIGDRVVVTDPPDELPPDDISLLLAGYSETIDQFEHTMTLNCVPESPWRVGILDDDVYGGADTAGSELAASVGVSDTSLSVATTSGPIWTQDAANFPFDVTVGGEVMTVSSITGSSSPQTFTVTRAVNGVTKPHTAGSDLRLTHPMIIAL